MHLINHIRNVNKKSCTKLLFLREETFMFFAKKDNVITVKYQDLDHPAKTNSLSKSELKQKKVDLEGLKALKKDPRILIMEVIV